MTNSNMEVSFLFFGCSELGYCSEEGFKADNDDRSYAQDRIGILGGGPIWGPCLNSL